MVALVGGAGVGAGAAATGATGTGATRVGAVRTGAAALTDPAPDPNAGVVGCPTPPPEEALVAAADAPSADSVRWSAAMTAESRANVRAFAAFWLAATVDTLDVVVLVVGTIVELTKALASPAPIRAIEVTTTDGRMRRRARDRRSARPTVARFVAMRSLATSSSSRSIASRGRIGERFG